MTPETIPTAAQLDHETVLDALLTADMREEAAVRARPAVVPLAAIVCWLPLVALIAAYLFIGGK